MFFICVVKYKGKAYFWPEGLWLRVIVLVHIGVFLADDSNGIE